MKKTVVTKFDDITQKAGEDVETVTFTVQGESFEIDLNTLNRNNLQRSLKKYMEHGRKVRHANGQTRQVTGRDVRHDREYVHTVRKWAHDQGIPVADRGRVPLSVYDKFEEANAELIRG